MDERDENGYTLRERQASKSSSLKDGAFWAVMIGSGETYVNPFAIKLGADSAFSGLLQTVPLFFGALSQLFALPLEPFIKNRRKTLAAGALLQACIWIPLALLAWWGAPSALPIVFGLFCLYQIFGQVINPPWSSWMAELVTAHERGAYFATRSRTIVLVQTFSVLGAAWLLDNLHVPALQAFAILFFIAFLSRVISALFLSRMADSRSDTSANPHPISPPPRADWGVFLSSPAMAEQRRFSLYIGAIITATYIASPFFDIYMFAVLGMDYTTWSTLVITQTLAKFVFFNYWGKAIDRFGNRAVLFGTGFLVPVVSLLWVFDHSFWWLFFAQVFSGLVWSGFELAAFNYTLSNPDRAMRIAQSAAYNFSKGTGSLLGMLMGGALLAVWPKTGSLDPTPFLAVFFISSMARYIASAYFLPRFSEHTFSGGMTGNKFLWEVLAVQPSRRMGRHLMEISETTLHLAQTEAGRTIRVAKEVGEKLKKGTQR